MVVKRPFPVYILHMAQPQARHFLLASVPTGPVSAVAVTSDSLSSHWEVHSTSRYKLNLNLNLNLNLCFHLYYCMHMRVSI